MNNLEVELRILLPDQTERPVKVQKSHQTQDVCKVTNIYSVNLVRNKTGLRSPPP